MYLKDPDEWLPHLDGRYAIVRVIGDEVSVVTDPIGLQPVYESRRDGTIWFSNVAALIASESDPVRTRAFIFLLARVAGNIGEPLSACVDRVEPGSFVTVSRSGDRTRRAVNAISPDDFRRTPGRDEAARTLVSYCAALGDWPARPVTLELSGGYDSRLVGAALRAAGCHADAVTLALPQLPGYPLTEDVELAEKVAALLGFRHSVIPVSVLRSDIQAARSGCRNPAPDLSWHVRHGPRAESRTRTPATHGCTPGCLRRNWG
jgi:asparagine synthetase B (glutamine-hydrolysing)